MLNQIFLGRLMTRDGGLSTLPELTRADGSSMIDTAHLDYDGNSQGGIMGIMLAAVSPDIERAVLGVPGINYSLLLPAQRRLRRRTRRSSSRPTRTTSTG